MNNSRIAQLLRILMKNRQEEAALLGELADEYDETPAANDTKTPRRPSARVPYVPEDRPVSDLAVRRAEQALRRAGIPTGTQRK